MQNKTLEKWEEKTLGDILSLEYGKALDKSYRLQNGQYKVYGANGVKDKTNKYLYDKRSIVVGRKGSAGELNYTEEKFWALDVCYYVVFDEQKYDLKFLYNLLKLQNLPTLAKGVKPGINRNDVYKLKIKIPNINEQQRIVRILDEAFENIEKAKQNALQNLNNAKELFESYVEQIFHYDCENIVSTTFSQEFKIRSGDFLSAQNMNLNGGYNVYGGNGINGKHDTYNYSGENIIIGRVGEKCGNIHYVNDDIWVTDNAFVLIDTEHGFDKRFLYYLLTKLNLRQYATKTTHPVISGKSLKDVKLRFPENISEQQKIVTQLDELQEQTKKLEQIYEQKIKDLDELKQSILQKAFNGEL